MVQLVSREFECLFFWSMEPLKEENRTNGEGLMNSLDVRPVERILQRPVVTRHHHWTVLPEAFSSESQGE